MKAKKEQQLRLDFSIIVPAYNAERSIARCIESACSQEYESYEVIIVDDGSTDGTSSIVQELMHDVHNLRLISQSNQGVYRSRRVGVEAARGEYCLFLDADDSVVNNLLNSLRPTIELYPDMIVFNAKSEHGSLCPGEWLRSLNLAEARREMVAGHLMNPIWNKCIKRSVLLKSSLDDSEGRLVYGEDAIQVASVLCHCKKVIGLNKTLYRYTANDESVTSTIDPQLRFDQSVRKQRLMCSHMLEWDLIGQTLSGFKANCLIYCADYCRALALFNEPEAIVALAKSEFFAASKKGFDRSLLSLRQRAIVTALITKTRLAALALCAFAQVMQKYGER